MIRRALFTAAAFFVFTGPIWSLDAVEFLFSIHGVDPNTKQKILIFTDSAQVVLNQSASAFLPGFSLDLEITALDSSAVEFNAHLVTLGNKGQAVGKRFKTEFGLPAIINDIEVKKGSIYSLTLVPSRRVQLSDRECIYNHNAGTDFTIFPSANFDLHFLKGSLASYHKATLKNLFETEYRLFRGVFHFSQSGKESLFLFPCESHSVIWDKRFGTAVDPTRNNCYSLYGTGLNTSDPFIMIHGSILRNYGYAPPFLSEGLANYFSMAVYTIKKLKKSGGLIPIKDLLNTKTYLTSDPVASDAIGATFVRYLIDKYTAENFMQLYNQSDDLNLLSKVESIYAKPIKSLEKEWSNYVDTLKIPGQLFGQFADRASQMWNYSLALEYRQRAYELSESKADSLAQLELLAGAYFLSGDYFNAAASQEKLARSGDKNYHYLLSLAGYRMMNGDYNGAQSDLMSVRSFDSTNEVLRFNLALNAIMLGDSIRASQIWNDLVNGVGSGQLAGESRVMLTHTLRHSEKQEDKDKAKDLLTVAIALFNQQMEVDPSVPNPYMWTGIALVGLGDGDNAYEQLNHALFLENRPFYIGMINLWLGKAADLRGKRDLAKTHYSEVLAGSSAAYHQDEAHKYIANPYSS
ncbi:MAG TPA: hypothetical protein VHP63_01930 [candidate division Zixibacteria bacterium]|nr:hypothetical protein [candidate division Zixibacteria bacterium]